MFLTVPVSLSLLIRHSTCHVTGRPFCPDAPIRGIYSRGIVPIGTMNGILYVSIGVTCAFNQIAGLCFPLIPRTAVSSILRCWCVALPSSANGSISTSGGTSGPTGPCTPAATNWNYNMQTNKQNKWNGYSSIC